MAGGNQRVILHLDASTLGFRKGLKKAEKSMKGTTQAVGISVGNMKVWLSGLAGMVAGAFAVGALVNFGKESVKLASTFEQGMAKINTIAKVTDTELKGMGDAISKIAGDTGTAVGDLTEATYQAISASVDAGDAVKFVADANKLAIGGFTETSKAVDILTTVMNSYKLEAKDASRISNMLITTQNLGKTTVDEMANSLGKVIPIANGANVNFENLATGMAVLTKNGIETSQASTYLRSIIRDLSETGSDADEVIRGRLGKSFRELMDEGVSLGDVLAELNTHAQENGISMDELFGRVEAGAGALAIAGAGTEEFDTILGQITDSAGATETAYQEMMDTFGRKTDVFKAKIQELQRGLGQVLIPFIGTAMDLAIPAIDNITDGLNSVSTKMQEVGLSSSSMTDAIKNMANVDAETMAGNIKLLGLQIVRGLGTAIEEGVPIIQEKFMALLQNVMTVATEAIPLITTVGIQMIVGFIRGIVEMIPYALETYVMFFTTFRTALLENLPFIIEQGALMLSNLIDGFMSVLPNIVQMVFDLITTFVTAIASNLPTILQKGRELIIQFITGIKDKFPQILESAKEAIRTMVTGIASKLPDIVRSGMDLVISLVEGLISMLPDIIMGAIELIGTLAQALWDNKDEILEAGVELIVSLIEGIFSMTTNLVDAGLELGEDLKEKFLEIEWLELGKDIIKGIISGIGSMAGSLLESVGGLASRALSWAKEKINSNSPSKAFRDEVGVTIPQGIAWGVNQKSHLVKRAVQDVAGDSLTTGKSYGLKARNIPQVSRGTGMDTATKVVYEINIPELVVREEADIEKIARGIEDIRRIKERAGGRVVYGT